MGMPDERSSLPARADAPPAKPPLDLEDRAGHPAGTGVFMLATGVVLASGLVLFGWDTLRVLVLSCLSAALIDYAARVIFRRRERSAGRQALLVGMLTACALPPTVGWLVPVVASALGVLVGLAFQRVRGRCLWHPVALGRVAVQMIFAEQLSPPRWPVLASGDLLFGDLSTALPLPSLATWASPQTDFGTQAWAVTRPADVLAAAVPIQAGASPAAAIAALVRDALPPWSHTLTGVAGGAIGEACVLAIIAAGLLLMWRGRAQWTVPVSGVLAGGLLAAVLPVTLRAHDGTIALHWLPGGDLWNGLPVGSLYVLYHLTAGEFLMVLLLLSADPAGLPLSGRGRVLFGTLIGGLTIALRVLTGLPAAGYWALLIANTFVPLMNRKPTLRVPG
jgi:Na+-translocating ferredoxin:NAD+ oxidoreductase subunit D